LELEILEDRSVPSGNASGLVSGFAFLDSNPNGVFNSSEITLPGMNINLTGTTSQGSPVSTSATTGAGGAFTFINVLPGTYQLSAPAGSGFLAGGANFGNTQGPLGADVISGISVSAGQTVHKNLGYSGLAPSVISMRLFLSSSTNANLPLAPAGGGSGAANYRPNSAPIVKTQIADVSVGKNSTQTTIDMAANFTDPDVTDTTVRFDTSDGPINVELFDARAPQTVANFLNYVLSGAYDSSIFHRLASVPSVLQGGGFTFDAASHSIPPIPTNPAVANEFGASNTKGTIAMAKLGNDPNSATDEFYFNLSDNTGLDTTNGGFTVFGKIVGADDQTVLDTLAATPVKNETNGNPASPFGEIPLNNYSGVNFPADTTASNYLLVKDVAIVNRDEFLTYSVVSNDNPNLVNAAIDPKDNALLGLTYGHDQTGTAMITIRATDRYGASVDTTFKVTVTEQAPTATVSFSPTSPLATDTLTATATGSDPDGDPVTLAYSWQINGQTVLSANTAVLDLNGLVKVGDTVTVTVTPNDGHIDGTPASSTATVASPSAGTLALAPSDPATTDTVTATLTGSNAHSFTYQWSVNNAVVHTDTVSTKMDALNQALHTGDLVTVQVTPSDGMNTGATVSASTTVNLPQASGLTLTPTSPAATDKITAMVGAAADPNGDPITLTYQWKVNNTVVQTTPNTSSLTDTLDLTTVANVMSGDTVSVEVTPNNGTIDGGVVSSSVTVA
jgi:peptidyl-prolyl cis-trans isomerase A (cyclophilin A)